MRVHFPRRKIRSLSVINRLFSTTDVGVEQLIEEDEGRFRQHAFCVGNLIPFTQMAGIERTKQIARFGKPRQQIIKSASMNPAGQ